MNSRVHPKYKSKYRVQNWADYERGLVRRGSITLWLTLEAVAAWKPRPTGKPGGQPRYSDLAIETALTLRLVFHMPLRQTEGFLGSIFEMMGVGLDVPDHTTLSRRSHCLEVLLSRIATNAPIHLIIDSTGLSIVGEGEWAAAKHGGKGRRGWKKLHLGVDGAGAIVSHVLTDGSADDARTGLEVIDAVPGEIQSITGDAAYDSVAVYDASARRGAEVVVPPFRTAAVSKRRSRSPARDRTIRRVKKVGQRRWKKESGYHRQGRVENTFFRYKAIIGDRLRARDSLAQATEVLLGCNVLNRMLELGGPRSVAIPR
jgi:IS5 family transposase